MTAPAQMMRRARAIGFPIRLGDDIDVYVTHAIPHRYPVGIAPDDIDFMGHVNNASYLKWVQAAVTDHWQALAPADAISRHLWVAIKHEITYRTPAFLEDDVIATVLLEKVQGARAFYETVIRRGEEVLADVKSSWCCLDASTLRPVRLAREVIQFFLPAMRAATDGIGLGGADCRTAAQIDR